jgi:hypothetical protein
LTHVFEHDAVVRGVEGAFEVRVHDVDVFVVELRVLHRHNEGGESVVDAAVLSEAVLLALLGILNTFSNAAANPSRFSNSECPHACSTSCLAS